MEVRKKDPYLKHSHWNVITTDILTGVIFTHRLFVIDKIWDATVGQGGMVTNLNEIWNRVKSKGPPPKYRRT